MNYVEGVVYKPMGEPYSMKEIKSYPGKFDSDGFYMLDEGGFFDPYGYWFYIHEGDNSGQPKDDYGGHYDAQGHYIPGPDYQDEYNKNYKLVKDGAIDDQMTIFDLDEQDGAAGGSTENKELEDEYTQYLIIERIRVCKKYVEEAKGKMTIQMTNIPEQANDVNILDFIKKT